MAENKRYKVIVSDKAKRMLGTHILFLARVNKEAAASKRKRLWPQCVLYPKYHSVFHF